MRHLGKGQEGSAALYVDLSTGEIVVVKTYFGIPRNDIPSHLAGDFVEWSAKWQTEIEAGLLLGN